jgi:hypothetical protein
LNETDDNGMTPLMLACEHGKPDMAQILLSAGADLNAKNAAGQDAWSLSLQKPTSFRGESCKPLIEAHLAAKKIAEVLEGASRGAVLHGP